MASQHSVREEITDVFPSHGWTWRDDENDVTATSIHDPECRRCKAEAALDGLLEQYEDLQRVAGQAVGDAAAWEAENRGLKEQLEALERENRDLRRYRDAYVKANLESPFAPNPATEPGPSLREQLEAQRKAIDQAKDFLYEYVSPYAQSEEAETHPASALKMLESVSAPEGST